MLAKSHAPDTFDFSSVLLFPSAPIVSASVVPIGGSGALNAYAWIGSISAAQVVVYSNNDGLALEVTVDQSSYSTTSKQG
jgi:hypothetical protein